MPQTWYNNADVVDLYERRARSGLRTEEIHLLEHHFASGARVLDLGCGTGRTTLPLMASGFDVLPVDLAIGLLASARLASPRARYVLMDATALGFEDDSFDIVFFSFNGIDCISPKPQRLQCLREMFRVTRPGGIVAFSSHNLAARVRNRFREKTLPDAMRSTWWEMSGQWWRPRFWQGYLRHQTMEGELTLYMSTVRRQIEQVRNTLGNDAVELVETISSPPGLSGRELEHGSQSVMYVWRKQ